MHQDAGIAGLGGGAGGSHIVIDLQSQDGIRRILCGQIEGDHAFQQAMGGVDMMGLIIVLCAVGLDSCTELGAQTFRLHQLIVAVCKTGDGSLSYLTPSSIFQPSLWLYQLTGSAV